MFGHGRVELKTVEQVAVMRRAGLVVADALDAVRAATRPGRSTADLDAVAHEVIRAAGAQPSFLGYEGFPATICASVNDEIVHGIPGPRVLRAGDVLSVDCGAIVDGWHGDSAVSFVVGDGAPAGSADSADPADAALVEATRRAMWDGIAALAGERLSEVGAAVEDSVAASAVADGAAYGVVQEFVGHGIGTAMHQPPDVPNYRAGGRGLRLRPGLCVAVEPMVTRGSATTRTLADDWTAVTTDGSRAAHWEHSVALLEDGLLVLTARDGGADELGARGVAVSSLAGPTD
ncbi:type I methionyl aminopeptidase [Cellulomonas sp. PhB143]|uniref:type I methionyl aminopeptidase n=1 Tax=Cellulomonas sp. PhB143 TaxID=2485186 RepID=UPI000F48213F|nr:type I methionyl aminopeptidase [Cellulomonas sp. PhB143]ROS76800.1 methionyl aminopeptidase [Cellulomonas sp. PhB143]